MERYGVEVWHCHRFKGRLDGRWHVDCYPATMTPDAFLPVHATRAPDQQVWRDPLALMLDSTGEGVFGVDLDGLCVFINPAGARMIGFDYDRCIRCYCCVEMCPHGALTAVETPPGRIVRRLAGLLARHGERFYGFSGLRRFKSKFDPQWRPRYLAAPGGMHLPAALLDATRLISLDPRRN